MVFGATCIVCGAESMKWYGFCLSVPFVLCSSVRQVCCCGPGRQEISVDRLVTNCISKENNDIIFVCSSLCVSIYFHQVLSYLTFDVDLCVCVCVGHDHSSLGIENEGQS